MKNPKELMLEYTAFSFRDPKMAPLSCRILRRSVFLHSRGRDAIAGFFQSVLDIYPGFQFENIKVLIDTPDQAFAEFEATAVSSKTGRSFINSSLRAWLARMEGSSYLEKLWILSKWPGLMHRIARACFEKDSLGRYPKIPSLRN